MIFILYILCALALTSLPWGWLSWVIKHSVYTAGQCGFWKYLSGWFMLALTYILCLDLLIYYAMQTSQHQSEPYKWCKTLYQLPIDSTWYRVGYCLNSTLLPVWNVTCQVSTCPPVPALVKCWEINDEYLLSYQRDPAYNPFFVAILFMSFLIIVGCQIRGLANCYPQYSLAQIEEEEQLYQNL